MSKLFLPYDIFERHKMVGEMIPDGRTVIDMGGQLNMLSEFCRPKKIVVANLESSEEKSDVIIKKKSLPFSDNSFDIACAIDVLEHIPKSDRKNFITKLLKVAKEKVIISFPLGTKAHIAYEKDLEKWLEDHNHDVGYLKEHIKYSLPSIKEIEEITRKQKAKLIFSGDLKINELLFKIFLFDPKIFILRRIIFLTKNIFYFLTNPILYKMLSNKDFFENVVRAYLVIKKR